MDGVHFVYPRANKSKPRIEHTIILIGCFDSGAAGASPVGVVGNGDAKENGVLILIIELVDPNIVEQNLLNPYRYKQTPTEQNQVVHNLYVLRQKKHYYIPLVHVVHHLVMVVNLLKMMMQYQLQDVLVLHVLVRHLMIHYMILNNQMMLIHLILFQSLYYDIPNFVNSSHRCIDLAPSYDCSLIRNVEDSVHQR